MKLRPRIAAACLAVVSCLMSASISPAATAATVDVDLAKPGVTIPPTFYGLMTEEINHSYDGGLFAELIQNRTFQDPARRRQRNGDEPGDVAPHWSIVQSADGKATIDLDKKDPVNSALPVSLKLNLAGGRAGVANDGYWGVPVRPDTKYTASFYAKGDGKFADKVSASIVTDDGNATVASADSDAVTGEWKKYTVSLTTGHDAPTTAKAKFVLSATGTGTVSFSLVSLFPPTYMDTPGGLRPDLMKLMADMKPAFIRLPGGNYLEGNDFPNRFDWKKMIGPADQRPGHQGCWGYRSSDGFGLPQYLLWCKQLNAEPVLAVFAGYTLNHDHVDPGAKMQQYVDEALEEIEYVSGPADSTWGKKRAEDGFPEPFKLHYVEIGNEDWFDRSGSYDGRFTQMAKAIREKYPDLKLIATAPVKSFKPDLYDDHYYRPARAMAFDWGHYDAPAATDDTEQNYGNGWHNGHFPRNGTQYFIGEWATQEGRPTPNLNAALADAVWTMGMERNGDIIPLQCYAPLFVNVNPGAWQWPTNLIGYDAMTAFGSPSYYALAMLGQNKGDKVLPVKTVAGEELATADVNPRGAIGVGTWRTQSEYKDITVTSPDGKTLLQADLSKNTDGWHFSGPKWSLADKAMKPSAADSTSWATIGDPKWTNYTLRLKARKLAGAEGFLVLFHAVDSENFRWWNIGGWGNSATRLQADDDGERHEFGAASNFTVETGKWYDLRVEVNGRNVKCYVDDKLVSQGTDEPHPVRTPLFASATWDSGSGEAIMKVVNFGNDPVDATLNLKGASQVDATGKAIVLAGEPRDVNTVQEPTKVAPKEEPITDAGASFKRTFPAHSFTLLRVKAAVK